MTAVALTDTSNIHGCHEFYTECKAHKITPILGTEILVESSLDESLNHKLVLLAKNLTGYRNIISLISKSNLDYPGKTPKIKFEDIEELKKLQTSPNLPLSGEGKKDSPLDKGEMPEGQRGLDIICLSGDIS
jgi:DNA polymerase-3 subunit alpha